MAFKEFSQQSLGVQLLQRSLARKRLGHAYLFTGDSLEELETLARDIADRGLRHPIVLLYKGDISRRHPKTVLEAIKKYNAELIDGRSRLDAIELIAEELWRRLRRSKGQSRRS